MGRAFSDRVMNALKILQSLVHSLVDQGALPGFVPGRQEITDVLDRLQFFYGRDRGRDILIDGQLTGNGDGVSRKERLVSEQQDGDRTLRVARGVKHLQFETTSEIE